FLITSCLLMPLQYWLFRTLEYVPIVSGMAAILLLAFLVARTGPRLLGFQVRERSVQRLMAASGASGDGEPLIDLPFSVPYRRSVKSLMLTTGLLSLAMGLMSFWCLPLARGDIAFIRILFPIGGAVSGLMGTLGIALFLRLKIVCEITSEGMNAPHVGGCVF